MCNKVPEAGPYQLKDVPVWFVTQQQIKILYDDDDDDELNKWLTVQKVKIKEELLPIAWHPSRWWDCCVSEDEKKETEKFWK